LDIGFESYVGSCISYLNPVKIKREGQNIKNKSAEVYFMSKKSWPILYTMLLFKLGQDFLDKE